MDRRKFVERSLAGMANAAALLAATPADPTNAELVAELTAQLEAGCVFKTDRSGGPTPP